MSSLCADGCFSNKSHPHRITTTTTTYCCHSLSLNVYAPSPYIFSHTLSPPRTHSSLDVRRLKRQHLGQRSIIVYLLSYKCCACSSIWSSRQFLPMTKNRRWVRCGVRGDNIHWVTCILFL